ncbi:MAG: hypothetical protein OEV27_11025 [Nitrospira sp.]|nr:hypothetical protein [Nitrospira sp.]MDH5337780.1 hypothetical protein [Nitrospira sp.]
MTMCVGDQPMTESHFSLYGTPVRYVTTSPFLAAPVNELLRHFRRDSLDESTPLALCFHAVQTRADIPLTLSLSARRLASGTGAAVGDRRETNLPYHVFEDGGRLIADFCDVGILVIDSAQGRADGYLIKPRTMHESLIEYLFHLALIELMRRRGLYTIHATALEKNGRGILIPGNSGRGKTTSFISLLRSGYRYLSDDHPLLRDAGTHVDLLPFPIKINVTEDTVAFFPELREAPDHLLHPGFPKRAFYAEKLYPTSIGDCCRPALVLFPHVIDAPHSRLESLSKPRALELLLPQALLVYDADVARREFQVLAKVVQQVDCYRLHFGRDILDLPKLITPLLEEVT